MRAQRRDIDSVLEILRDLRSRALAQSAKDKANGFYVLEAFESGRASGLRTAIAMLDPASPEQKEIDEQAAKLSSNAVAMVNGRSGEPAASPILSEATR